MPLCQENLKFKRHRRNTGGAKIMQRTPTRGCYAPTPPNTIFQFCSIL